MVRVEPAGFDVVSDARRGIGKGITACCRRKEERER